jgi:hypothetical protein
MSGALAVHEGSSGINIEKELAPVLERIKAIKVIDAQTFEAAGISCAEITEWEKKVGEYWDEDVERAHKAHKSLVAKRAAMLDPLGEAKKALRQQMGSWHQEEERKRLESERQAQESARKQAEDDAIAQAAELEKQGRPEEAARVVSEPVAPPPVVVRSNVPKGFGQFTRKTWKFEVTDMMALVKAVAAGQVPLNAIQANTVFLGNQARALNENMKFPGVKVWAERG